MTEDLLFEIGTEELPASFVQPALQDLRASLTEKMELARLSFASTQLFGTPRRLAVLVCDLAEQSEDITREVLGPPTKIAFDGQGKPTKAAEKFAQSLQLPVDQLQRVTTPKGEYLAARVVEKGRSAHLIAKEVLEVLLHSLRFPKSMRWGEVEQSFARPVHWILALLGTEVLPLVFADVASGRFTRGHRFLAPEPIEVRKPADYEELLLRASVIADPLKRKGALLSRLQEAARRLGASLLEDDALVDQVNYLIELPNPVLGSFDRRHLDLPREVLVQEMRGHQRYFSLVDASGNLLPNFLAVSNMPVRDEKLSVRGYERVLRARLADGRFFFDQDRKVPLADRAQQLGRVVWQAKLGTYAEKVVRLTGLATFLAERANRPAQLGVIQRAATLCKADLVTGMVQEFPELQGVMGREYAKSDGEPAEVCRAIFEHYLPRTASDLMPTEDPGALLGIADRLDTLCGIFAIGKAPTGAADPFGLRRACLAVIHIVLARRFRFSLAAAVERALSQLEPKLRNDLKRLSLGAVKEQVLDFFRGRLKSLWGEQYPADLVEAVLAAGFDDLVAAQLRLEAVSRTAGAAGFEALTTALKRAGNIVEKQGKDVGSGQVSPERLVEQAERNLYRVCIAANENVKERAARDDFGGALAILSSLGPSVDAFFNEVMVMSEDRELRKNRIHLLQLVRTLFGQVADFSKVHSEIGSVSAHAH